MTREDAINIMKVIVHMLEEQYDTDRVEDAVEMAITALEQESILDKIRAEIEQEYTKFRNKSDMWNERACGLGTALEIIDKYTAEKERG
jgi:hypothetical protein